MAKADGKVTFHGKIKATNQTVRQEYENLLPFGENNCSDFKGSPWKSLDKSLQSLRRKPFP